MRSAKLRDRRAIIAATAPALRLAAGDLDSGHGRYRSFSASARSWSWNRIRDHAWHRTHST